MKALCFFTERGLKLCSKPIPKISPGEALLKVKGCTICGSDLRVLKGEKGIKREGVVLGHEIWGEVAKSKTPLLKEGEYISLFPSVFCGKCATCISGAHNLCYNKCSYGSCMDGGFAEYVKIPEPIIETTGFYKTKYNTLANCLIEPLGCVLHSAEVLELNDGDKLLILGGGPLGLMHLVVAKIAKAEVVLVDRNSHRRETAKRLYENITTYSSMDQVKERFTKAVVCAPAFEELDNILNRLYKKGKINLFAGSSWEKRASFTPNTVHYGEIIVTGTHSTTLETFHRAGKVLEENIESFQQILTHTFRLERFAEAFSIYAHRKGLKVALIPYAEA